MVIEIITNQSFNPSSTKIKVNGNDYKTFEELELRISKNSNGQLVITHASGYVEAYKAEVNNELP